MGFKLKLSNPFKGGPKAALTKLMGKGDKLARYIDPGANQRVADSKKAAEEAVRVQAQQALDAQNAQRAANLAANMQMDLGLDNLAVVQAGGEAEQAASAYVESKRKRAGSGTALASTLGIRA